MNTKGILGAGRLEGAGVICGQWGNQVVHFCIKFYGIRILPLRSHLQPSVAPTPLLTYFTMAHKSSASSFAMVPPAASGLSLADSGSDSPLSPADSGLSLAHSGLRPPAQSLAVSLG